MIQTMGLRVVVPQKKKYAILHSETNLKNKLHEENSENALKEKAKVVTEAKRGPGRLKKIKTGKPGRPKRLFHEAANYTINELEDPTNVENMLSRKDKQL